MSRIKIGVFDSGIGGLSVVEAIKREIPELEIIFKNDAEHVPYGKRSIDQIYQFTKPIIQNLVDEGCDAIIIACNTVTTNLITKLREEFTVPLVGMEPMVKPAALATKTGVIAVCATQRTLESSRYRWLKVNYARGIKVIEPDCSEWTLMVEANQIDRKKVEDIVEQICQQNGDVIVLGCTHYHWIEKVIRDSAAGRALVLQPELPVIKQLKSVLLQLL